jgi:hypothetical protein
MTFLHKKAPVTTMTGAKSLNNAGKLEQMRKKFLTLPPIFCIALPKEAMIIL